MVTVLVALPASASTPTLATTITSAASPHPFARFDATGQTLADFRGDGHLQVVAQNDNGYVYVIDPRAGTVLAELHPNTWGCTSACYGFEGISGPINSPAVADVDGSGRLSVVVGTTSAGVTRYVFDKGASTPTHFVFQKVWERHFTDYQSFTTLDASPVLADLLGNGQKETVVVVEQKGVFAVKPDGSLLWKQPYVGGHATPGVGDLTGDGKPEVVLATDSGTVSALDGKTGAVRWASSVRSFVSPGSIPEAPLVSDITGDGRRDVVVVARDAHDTSNYANDHIGIVAFDGTGHELWHAHPSWAAPLTHTRLVLLNLNGQRVLLGADWNTIGHKPGNFERVGPGHVFLLTASGKELWHRDLNVPSSTMDLVVADAVGDGTQQVLIECTQDGKSGICAFNLADGKRKLFLDTGKWQVTRSLVAGDLFGDGRLAFVAPVNQGGSGALMVFHGSNPLNAAFPGWGGVKPPVGH